MKMKKAKVMGWGMPDGLKQAFIESLPGDEIINDLIVSGSKEFTLDPVTGIEATLKERGSRYGNFAEQGRIEQNIKRAFADSPNWATLKPDSKSALEMIATKISRILKGDPEYADSWHDIIGYAKLVEDRINTEKRDDEVSTNSA